MGGAVSLPVIYLGPNYGGGNEDNGDLLQKVPRTRCYNQCPQPCSWPPPTHASAGDSRMLTGKSGSVSWGSLLLSPGSWCPRFCLRLQESVSQSCVSSGGSMVGLVGDIKGYRLPTWCSGKEPTCQCRRYKRQGFDSWVRKIPWSGEWQPTSVFLPGKSCGQESLVVHSPWDRKEMDITEQLDTQTLKAAR